MGAYLSTPVCVKESEDGGSKKLKFGASSMQGWRISQEDAHCCLLDFDAEKDTALFAVFDGHGGSDVAQYTAKHLPDYVKAVEAYKTGKLESALEEAFLGFDATLVEPDVVKVLKDLANGGHDEENEEEDEEETAMLCEEAEMPLESLLERYGGAVSVGGVPGNKALLALKKKKEKFQSPALRPKPESKTSTDRDSETGSEDTTRIRLDDVLANGCDGGDNGVAPHKEDSTGSENVKSSADIVPVEKDLGDKPIDSNSSDTDKLIDKNSCNSDKSLDKDSNSGSTGPPCPKSDSHSHSVANGKTVTADTRTVASSDADAAQDAPTDKVAVLGALAASKDETESHTSDCNDLDVSHISDVSDGVLNHSSETNLSSDTNNAAADETVNTKAAIRLQLTNIRLKKAEVEAEMEKLEEEVDKMEEKSEELEKSMQEILSKDEAGARELVEERKKEDEALQKKISESNEKIVSLENRRVEMKRRISNLKKFRLQVLASEKASKRAAAGKGSSTEEEEEEEEEDDEDISDDNEDDDDDDDDDDSDDEEEEEEDDDDCTAMMGCGDEPGQDSGCTAVVALLHGTELHVANAGDSRCVLSRAGCAIDMSVDHKPEDTLETERIHKAGGRVTCDGRVNGGLNLSRAIGDHCYKQNKTLSAKEQMITSLPDVKSLTVGQEDEFMIIACDGIWNVMTSQEAVDFVRERLMADKNCKLSKICEDMFDLCIAPDTSGDGTGCDNMTCVIVTFDHFTSTPPTSTAPPTSSTVPPTSSTSTEANEAVTSGSSASSLKRKAEEEPVADDSSDAAPAESKRAKEDTSASNASEQSS